MVRAVSNITTEATVMPTAWIDSENVRATAAGVSRTLVKIGNATAPTLGRGTCKEAPEDHRDGGLPVIGDTS